MPTPSTGLVTRTLDEIRTELREGIAAAPSMGPAWQTGPDTTTGQTLDIVARSQAQTEEALQGLYDSFDPDQAQDAQLDNIAGWSGVFREAARATTAIVTATGTPATLILAGSIFKIPSGAEFTTDADATIGGGGTVAIPCTAVDTGAILAPDAAITEIVSVTAGLDSITNLEVDTVVGRALETDEQLRARRELSLQSRGAATVPAIRAALLALLIVDECIVLSNRTLDDPDVNGLPPKSFRAIVWPDPGVFPADTEIFETIFVEQPAGIESDGARSGTVTDAQLIPQTVKYSVAVELVTFVTVTLTVDATYPVTGDDDVKQAILDAIGRVGTTDTAQLAINETLYLLDVTCAAASIEGVRAVVTTALVGAPPGGGDTSDIVPAVGEIITVDGGDILVLS